MDVSSCLSSFVPFLWCSLRVANRSCLKSVFQVVTIESHDHTVCESDVVPGVHSAWHHITMASDRALFRAAHRHNSSHTSHSSLFDLAHITMTFSYASVHLEIVSRQHLSRHLRMISSLKLAILVFPTCGDACLYVVDCCVRCHVICRLRNVRPTPHSFCTRPMLDRSTRKID